MRKKKKKRGGNRDREELETHGSKNSVGSWPLRTNRNIKCCVHLDTASIFWKDLPQTLSCVQVALNFEGGAESGKGCFLSLGKRQI